LVEGFFLLVLIISSKVISNALAIVVSLGKIRSTDLGFLDEEEREKRKLGFRFLCEEKDEEKRRVKRYKKQAKGLFWNKISERGVLTLY
jgi:hypothetical protein